MVAGPALFVAMKNSKTTLRMCKTITFYNAFHGLVEKLVNRQRFNLQHSLPKIKYFENSITVSGGFPLPSHEQFPFLDSIANMVL